MLAIAAMGGLVLASCDDDDTTNEIPTHGLAVTSAATSFEAKGGTNDITVAQTPISAYANDDWATVAISGNTVSVTAAQNNGIETRHTTVVVKSSAQDSAVVNIDQDGMVFQLSASNLTFNDNASRSVYTVKHNLDVNIETKADWLTAVMSGDSLTISATENTTGSPRLGYVYYTSGDVTDSILVKQFDSEKDVPGDYDLVYYDSDDDAYYYTPTNISRAADGTYAMRFTTAGLATYGWTIPVTVSTDAPAFTFTNLSNAGTFTSGSTSYTVLMMVLITDGESIYTYRSTDLTATAECTLDETGEAYWPLTAGGISGYDYYGLRLGLSSDGTTYNSSLGALLNFYDAQFIKEDASDDDEDASAAKSYKSLKSLKNFKGSKFRTTSAAHWKAPQRLPQVNL